MRDVFVSQGKAWDDDMECELKKRVAEIVAGYSQNALDPHRKAAFNALVKALEKKVKSIGERAVAQASLVILW